MGGPGERVRGGTPRNWGQLLRSLLVAGARVRPWSRNGLRPLRDRMACLTNLQPGMREANGSQVLHLWPIRCCKQLLPEQPPRKPPDQQTECGVVVVFARSRSGSTQYCVVHERQIPRGRSLGLQPLPGLPVPARLPVAVTHKQQGEQLLDQQYVLSLKVHE